MRIGIFGSSFNPPTNGHLWSAQTIANREGLEKIIFLPSSSKRVDKEINIEDEHRLNMLKLAIEDNPLFEISNYELQSAPGKQYTYYTMQHFKEIYPSDEVFFLMGADLLTEISSWTMGKELIKNNKFIVIERKNIIIPQVIAENPLLRRYERNFIPIYKGLVNEISSTYIREEFEFGGDPRYLLPENVYQYIKDNKLYLGDEGK